MNVDLHNSWLVINSVRGCTNGCKYCFLKDNLNQCFSKMYCSPKEVIQELLNYRYYDECIPLCLFPNTDIFLNQRNIDYLLQTLDEIENQNISNDLVIITKCLIPKYVLQRFQNMQLKGYRIVVYLSYSGLDQTIEPNVKHADILKNFQMLNRFRIPCIHYFRPLIPQNSSKEKILEILNTVRPYTQISVVAGLMTQGYTSDKFGIWKELQSLNSEILENSSSIYPEEAWNFFQNYNGEHFIFQTNTCALNMVLNKPSFYYHSKECDSFDNCSHCMRKRCRKAFLQRDYDLISKKLVYYLKKLGITNHYSWEFGSNFALNFIGKELDHQTLTYLSFVLGIKVCMFSQNDEYYSSLKKDLFVFREVKNG